MSADVVILSHAVEHYCSVVSEYVYILLLCACLLMLQRSAYRVLGHGLDKEILR